MVKELIENSLDAGASSIAVEVRGLGTEYLRVADNGSGIPAAEVELAFQRHATSKLLEARDLGSISTLGFRGEALPSIAAVSRVTLVTRTASETSGTRIDVEDGGTLTVSPQGAAEGTVVTVQHLFRNFPVRRRFLRTAATEVSRVQTLVTRYALAFPGVRLQLVVDGETVFSSSGLGSLREAVSDVYGSQVAAKMLVLGQEQDDQKDNILTATGLVGPPSLTRANRSHISLFVNSRWVQSRMLAYALEQAYHGFLMERRYPMAVVNLTVPFEEVDVNIHPAKAEVRFRHEGQVFQALQQAVRQTLTSHSPVPHVRDRSGTTASPVRQPLARPFWPVGITGPPGSSAPSAQPADDESGETAGDTLPLPRRLQPMPPRAVLPVLRVLGQVHSTYIAAEGPDGMYLIDQHAAHERVLFERLRATAVSGPVQVQSLLEPATVELDARQHELVQSHDELLSRLGFHIEAFGARTWLIRGVPAAMSGGDASQDFMEVLDLMAEGGGFESWEERAAYSIACHSAVKAGNTLSREELSELTRQLESCQQPHTCPHGRPTMVHMSAAHLEREFGRT